MPPARLQEPRSYEAKGLLWSGPGGSRDDARRENETRWQRMNRGRIRAGIRRGALVVMISGQ